MVEVKSEPCLCCLWVDKWKFHFQYQEALRIVEKPRESSRSHEKTREASSSLERPREDPRRLERALLGASMNFAKVRYQLYCSYVCLPRLRKLWLRCWGTKPANRSKTRSFFHVIRLYRYPNIFSSISDLSSIGYNIHLHYMILLYIEHWKVVM